MISSKDFLKGIDTHDAWHALEKIYSMVFGIDNKYEVDPLSKNFCVAALMKFIIDNLDELLLVIKDPKDIEIILTRMSEGSEKLRHDFWTQTVEFSKKKCQHWSPPISEKLILSFAILNTADINDCASKSAILDFIYANFPWYQLTKENFGPKNEKFCVAMTMEVYRFWLTKILG